MDAATAAAPAAPDRDLEARPARGQPLLRLLLDRLRANAALADPRRGARARATLAIVLARCINAVSLGLAITASTDLMYSIIKEGILVQGNEEFHGRVQKFSTNLNTAVTLANFLLAPLVGRSMDAAGRLPTMLGALITSGLLRLSVAARPSALAYAAYRVLMAVSVPAFFGATEAALGDLYGRGTKECVEASTMVSQYALPALIVGTTLGGQLRRARRTLALCGALQLCSAATLAALLQETIPVRKTMVWSLAKINPLGCVQFFRQSRALSALAVLSVVRELPTYINLDGVYLRQKFHDWGSAQEAHQMVVAQVSGLLSTFLAAPLLARLGPLAAIRLHAWCDVAMLAHTAAAPRMFLHYLGPLLSLPQCGARALSCCLEQEAERLGLGQGELGAAEASRSFLPSLIAPYLFTRLYERTSRRFPAAAYAVAAAGHIFAAEVVAPWAVQACTADKPPD